MRGEKLRAGANRGSVVDRLKWLLSAASALAASFFVVVLESSY